MNTTIEKSLDYRCFLLGIILYWMFDAVWASFTPFLFALEAVLHPTSIVVGKSLLFLLVFYLLFRKPRMFDVKWGHLAMLVGFILLMTALDVFLLDRFFDVQSVADNRMECDVTMLTMRNVRKWTNLAVSLLFIGFLWWCYDSEKTEADAKVPAEKSRSYYAGILFVITIEYMLYAVSILGGILWFYVHQPVLMEVILCLLMALVTGVAIYLLAKRRTIVFPLAVIIAVVAVHFFISNYLGVILFEHCTANTVTTQYGMLFDNVANCCNWVLFLAAFVLYRREMKQQNV
ncbi:MAG: hypothetical protein IJL57_01890 [Bacteroidales bacterium]|nr:hypothetical protein [Bacteroidales bacterium]